MTQRTYVVFGISVKKDKYNVRAANNLSYSKVLDRDGHSDIRLVVSETVMSKLDGAYYLRSLPEFQDAIAQTTITDFIYNNENKEEKANTPKRPKLIDTVLQEAIKVANKDKEQPGNVPSIEVEEELDDDILAMAMRVAKKSEKELENEPF